MPTTRRPPTPGRAARPGGRPVRPPSGAPAATRRRAAGPSPADRRRGRNGFLLPEVVTVRALVLSVVVLLAVVILLPTARAYVNQAAQLREMRATLAQAQEQRDALEVELARWEDERYVVRQARDRLSFVMPGDRPWRVLDPETVVDDIDPATGLPMTDGPVRGYDEGTAWYEAIWSSIEVAGGQGDQAPAETGDNG